MDTSRIVFGRFALDPGRGSLFSGEREIILRPESWAVLRYLASHPDRWIPGRELLAAGWPGLDVGDAALLESIDQLRHALGDTDSHLIVHVPADGFRFVPAAAPGERRKARGWHPLRWRWVYGILAPLLLALTVVALLLLGRS